ncbi:MAG: phospholipase C, phosphocholine-specific [Bacteroidota bacterium]|nr:phospholipase C, phosphocholine-specific [Bacteroidota bacterium]
MDTRREFIKKAGLLSGAAGLFSALPPSIQKALAINPAAGTSFLDAEHVVLLMQENRSFDHCYGSLRGVRGYNDPRAISLPNKNPVWLQSNARGETYAPFHLDIKNTRATWGNSLPHSWDNQVDARNDGKYDQWLNVKHSGNKVYAKVPLTMGFHNREDIPFYYALADAFTVCDQHFCSCLTGTSPNRNFFWTGTVRDTQDENSRALVWNEDMDFETLRYRTFPELLEQNDISWKVYQNELSVGVGFEGEQDDWLSNFTDNNLEFFEQYHARLNQQHIAYVKRRSAALPQEIEALQKKIESLPASDTSLEKEKKALEEKQKEWELIKAEMGTSTQEAWDKLSAREKNLHMKGLSTNTGDPDYHQLTELTYDDDGVKRTMQMPKGDVLHQFREDVKTGALPMVSWLVAPENFSDHPGAPWYGAWYVSEVLDILTQNPEVWKKTIFILTYDENDGYFDHVPPFVAPHSHKSGTGKVSEGIDTRVEFVTYDQELDRHEFPRKYNRESAVGLGYRVPLVIASPWSRGGFVNSEVCDHTSTLQFLEEFLTKKTGKKITETNISDWRRTICGNLNSVFRPYNGEKIEAPQPVNKDMLLEEIHKAKFKKVPSDYTLLSAEDVEAMKKSLYDSPYMTQQEKGIRMSCALPYQLYADGKLSADKKSFGIRFEAGNEVFGEAASGSPFNVYAPGKYRQEKDPANFESVRTWAYTVKAADHLDDHWPLDAFENEQYHLRVYGPNGFFREFKGDAADPLLDVICGYEAKPGFKNKLTGNVELKLVNGSGQPYTVEITDHAYKAPPIKKTLKSGDTRVVLNLSKSYGWYDFSVKVTGAQHFEKRYAGRVETGKHSYSDPFMGRMV